MLTNDFGNPFLTRSLLQIRSKMGIPFLALQNELDSFALSLHTRKAHLPHLSHLSQPTHQLHPHQLPQFPVHHPNPNTHSLQYLHPSHYNLHPSHYPSMYAGAAVAAAAAAAAIEQSIPFSRHVMAVTPSLTKAFFPQGLSMKNPEMVGIGTLGVGFHREHDKNNNENNNEKNNHKSVNERRVIGHHSTNSCTVEDKLSVLNDKGITRSMINQSVRMTTDAPTDAENNVNNSSNNHNIRLLGGVGPSHDYHRNLMFYQGQEKSERGRKIFLCPQCHYVTDRKNNLKRHIITMHQDCPKILECCGVMFRSKAMLREHVSLFHSSGYRCRVCGRNFCRKALLRRHLSVHSGQKDFICPLCSYATSHKSNLERHQKVHNKKSTLGGIGISNTGMKGLSEELSKVSVVAEMPENSYDHNSTTSQVCIPTADTYLYRSPPIETAIGIPRIKKFLLPDRLNQTYTNTRSQSIGSDTMGSSKNITLQMMNEQKESEKSDKNYRYRHLYNNSDSSSDDNNHHLYTHHHHHHHHHHRHHHHRINTTVTSLEMGNNHETTSPEKIIKRKPPRIFMTSYKCIDCRKVFSHQSLLNSHSCLNDRPNGEGYLSIVRPLTKKQPVKQIMTLASQGPTTSTAVVVVSTSVNNWCESINRYPTSSIRSQPNGNLGALTEEEMAMFSPKDSYFGYSPTLCHNTCGRTSLKLKGDEMENNYGLVAKNTSKDFSMDVSNDDDYDDDDDDDDDDIIEQAHQNDDKSAIVDEHVQVNSKCIAVKCLKMNIMEQIDRRKQSKCNEHPGWSQQKDSDNSDCKMREQREVESENELQGYLKRDGKEEKAVTMKEEHFDDIELTKDGKVEVDIIDNDIDINDYDELEEDQMSLPFKKRPVKENIRKADEMVDA